ncbi:hypothetical protein [uncultured Pseudoteredinibacter sp.]|uniref:hypothetical protein n=1 Tax=uncultured Pseudoteredinibacter sp. TaxID=1641701 RepID=UPI00261A70B3|nr:hypothetical protein [uncultured Pseudoteredinibacter sp.]
MAKKSQEAQSKQKKVIGGLIGVVAVVTAVGMFVANQGPALADPDTFSDGIPVYGKLSLNDARIACERYTRKSLGKQLKTLSVDTRSSRLDNKKGQYMVYMEAYLYENEMGGGKSDHYYVNCASDKSKLSLAKYELIKNENEKTKAKRKEKGSRYGWQ